MSRAGRGESSRFEAGFAKEIIAPARGIALCGYCEPRPNEGVLDDLFVKALLIRAGRVLTGVVSCEVIWISREIVRRVRQKLVRLGMSNADQVLFCATHTHTGPYITPYFGEEPDESYIESLRVPEILTTSFPEIIATLWAVISGRVASQELGAIGLPAVRDQEDDWNAGPCTDSDPA